MIKTAAAALLSLSLMCAPIVATRDAGAKLTTPPDAGTGPRSAPSCPTGSGCDAAPTSATSAPSCPAGNCD